MTHEEIMGKFTEIFRDLFEDDTIVLTDHTTANDIEDWDSLAHLQLIAEIESQFAIKFTLGEVNSFANVGELVDCVARHMKS